MIAVDTLVSVVTRRWSSLGLRWRVVLTSSFVVIVAFLIGARLLHDTALQKQHDLQHHAEAEAMASATSFDREVAAASYLLMGLSKAPSVVAGDNRTFYDQLAATPRPDGSWFVLWDQDGQVLNTSRPFGTLLPRAAEWDGFKAGWNRVHERGTSVSSRVRSPVSKTYVIVVAVRIDDAGGQMRGFLTANLPEARLAAVVRDHVLPDGWATTVFDRNLVPTASSMGDGGARVMPAAVRDRLGDRSGAISGKGYDPAANLFFAFQRSGATDFVTVTTVPEPLMRAPVTEARRKITWAGLALLLAGGAAGLLVSRQVAPVETTATTVARQLRLAQARYASLWNDTPESLFVVSVMPDGRFVFEGLNPAHERATGLAFDAIAGKAPEECLPPEAAAAVTARYRACLQGGAPMIYDEILDFPSGQRFWQTSLAPVRDPETGRIVLLIGTARDVTADRMARLEIERSQMLLQTTLDALSAHIAILDDTGTIIAVNRAWHRFAEAGDYAIPDHGIGTNYLAACQTGEGSDRSGGHVVEALVAVLARRSTGFRASYSCGDRFFQMSVARFCHEGATHAVVAHEDVTELVSARRDVRDIAGRLLSLQEDERQRIAADLHDSTAQHLVAAGLGLMHIDTVAGNLTGVQEALGAVRSSLDEAHKEIRTLSYLLYPPNLRANGLTASLRLFVTGFMQRTGLQGRATVAGNVDGTPIEVQQSVLRVVQEALVNVHRHAEATRVSVTLRRNEEGLHLIIRDNGKGLPRPKQDGDGARPPLGVGIPGMEARIRQLDGRMTMASSARGTTIRATIPTAPDGGLPLPLDPEQQRIWLQ